MNTLNKEKKAELQREKDNQVTISKHQNDLKQRIKDLSAEAIKS
jgi:hypothetical protein